jgi:hypothetical protein
MPFILLDLSFSALLLLWASFAAGLESGVCVFRPSSGVAGVDVEVVMGAFALGGVEIAAEIVETLRWAGVDADVVVVVVVDFGPVVVACDELLCALTCRAFPIIPWTQASLSGFEAAGEPEEAARIFAFLMPPLGPAAPRGV